MRYFDAHSHLNFSQYDEDREAVLARMHENNVATVTVGTNVKTSEEAIALAANNENMWASVGIHPISDNATNGTSSTESFEEIRGLINKPKVVAVGECGLDYFRITGDVSRITEKQQELFEKHIELAQAHSLPLIVHCRPSAHLPAQAGAHDAYDDLLAIFSSSGQTTVTGVMHFFAGTPAQARRFLELGMYISFAGPVTFTDEYDTVIQTVPLKKLLIETDAPFAAPAPHRGGRNEPTYVIEVAKKIASVKQVPVDTVAAQTKANTKRLFNI